MRNALTTFLLAGLLVACESNNELSHPTIEGSGTSQGGAVTAEPLAPLPLYNPKTTVCDPFDIFNEDNYQPVSSIQMGLKGKMYFLTSGMDRFQQVADIPKGIDSQLDIFLKDVNVPTRMFDRGFPTASGSLLMVNNEAVTEWFGLTLDSNLRLTEGDEPGLYQLALISDDGATLDIQQNEDWVRWVDADGTHSSRLACSELTLQLDRSSSVPIKLDYYQGPRTEIALMLMWRKVDSANEPLDKLCGATGQNLFFEYRNNPSTPQPAYRELESRGWRPLAPENYGVGDEDVNPCLSENHWQE